MFGELSTVILAHDITEYSLTKGDEGTIVYIYGNGEAYEVEFINSHGETIAVLTLNPSEIRALEINSTNTWVKPVWSGLEPTPSIEIGSNEAKTRMFYSQL